MITDCQEFDVLRKYYPRARLITLNIIYAQMKNLWIGMKGRCNNPRNPSYKYYGGRGICVYKRWADSFFNFLIDMGPKPVGKSLDRINNNGNYTYKNCRWATPKQQTDNRRITVRKAREWTTSNVEDLEAYASRGESSTFAAKLLRRSPGAVRFKAQALGIRFKSLGARHSRLQRARWAKARS